MLKKEKQNLFGFKTNIVCVPWTKKWIIKPTIKIKKKVNETSHSNLFKYALENFQGGKVEEFKIS